MMNDSPGSPAPSPPASSRTAPLPGANWALLLLLCMNMFNYIDRQVLAAVEPEVCHSLLESKDPEAEDTGKKMGLLATAFLVSYMLAAPVFGRLAERYSRWTLIAVGVLVWSLASGASGLAQTYLMLLITRCFVGIGEAAYGPVAPAIISDLYPLAIRGRVLAWFYMAIPVGGALGYAVGEQFAGMAPALESWRWGFYAVVVPGLLLTVWAMWMRDPSRSSNAGPRDAPRRTQWRDYLVLLRTPSYVLNTAGMTAMTFAIGALAWWMPAYLKSNDVPPLWGMGPRTFFGVTTAVAGLVATMAGGLAGDWLRKYFSGSYFLVSGAGLLISTPCTLLFLAVPFPWAWVFVFLAVFFLFFNTGPTNTILANVTHPSMRATGFALNILVIHAFGDASSPYIVGAIKDSWGLTPGFVVVSVFMALGGVIWLWGARYLEHDTDTAPTRLQ